MRENAMFNRRRENEISLSSPLPVPRRIAWWLWTGLGIFGLLCLLAWAGEDHRAWQDGTWDDWMWGWVQDLTGWIAQVISGLGRVFSGNSGLSFGQRLGIFLAATLVVYLYWRATRALLAFMPGPVDVQELTDETSAGLLNTSTGDLTAEFRRQLSDSKIYAPTTLPAEAPPMSFLDLVGDVDLDPKKLGNAIPRLLSRLRPKLAYRVGGVLRTRDLGTDNFGITATVTAYVFGGARSTTLWGNDWGEVIRKAGCWVISTLLPITRAGRYPPWRNWWGRELNPDLYEAYQNANELRRDGHYHEALPRYYEAIALDPTNSYLRGELAEVLEKMGLHIDALDTCQRALTLDGQSVAQYNKRLWQQPWNPHLRRFRYLRHPRLHRYSLGLRYRNVVAIGTSEYLAEQWYERKGMNDRETRDRLIPVLVDRYWQAATGLSPPGREKDWLTDVLRRSCDTRKIESSNTSKTLVRLVLQRAATQELKRLAADDLWARVAGLYWPARLLSFAKLLWPFSSVQSAFASRQAVTRGAFLVNQRVWAPLRLGWAQAAAHRAMVERPGPVLDSKKYQDSWRRNHSISISVTPEDLRRRVRRAQSRVVLLRHIWPIWQRRDWLTHYNSACVYAIAMKAPNHIGDCERHAKHAIEELESAVLVPSGDFATVERIWMVDEDPDLEALRIQPLFRSFVCTTFPEPEVPALPTSNNWLEEQMRDYDYRLLEATAKVMQNVWNLRIKESMVDIRTAIEWLRFEGEIWRCIHEVADEKRLWRWAGRVELIDSVQIDGYLAVSTTTEFPPQIIPGGAAPVGRPCISARLRALTEDLERKRERDDTPYTVKRGQYVLRDAAASGVTVLKRRTVRKLCSGYCATWQTLGEWLARDRGERLSCEALEKVPQPTLRRRLAISDPRKVLI
ncbi:tetratricopeptide repeat protein [Streptomyces sp. MS1.AVA.1]|uniref:Tetratricopeptide repeat protein n=1 Tax=Streptomyces machairae TaxID=3134109 RepID=A0ABU8USY0_9ACTN